MPALLGHSIVLNVTQPDQHSCRNRLGQADSEDMALCCTVGAPSMVLSPSQQQAQVVLIAGAQALRMCRRNSLGVCPKPPSPSTASDPSSRLTDSDQAMRRRPRRSLAKLAFAPPPDPGRPEQGDESCAGLSCLCRPAAASQRQPGQRGQAPTTRESERECVCETRVANFLPSALPSAGARRAGAGAGWFRSRLR